jgi:hypothetical protein
VGHHALAHLARRARATMVIRLGRPRRASSQYRCGACGYGISLKGELPLCLMCQRRDWQPVRIARESRRMVAL